MTGFWKTDRNFTLGLYSIYISPANSYTHTLSHTVVLPGLVNWFALLERPCKVTSETMGFMEVLAESYTYISMHF